MKVFYLIVIFSSQLICSSARALDFGTFVRDFAASESERVEREDKGLDSRLWDRAYRVAQENTGDPRIQRCFYKTNRGFAFNVNFRRSSCPSSVFVNPETNQVIP